MLIAKIPKDIKEYKEKIMFGLSGRQLLSVIVAAVICVPLYIFGVNYLGDSLTGWLVMVIAAPIVAFGFVKYNGMQFEHFIVAYFRYNFILPRKRKFIIISFFEQLEKELIRVNTKQGGIKHG